MEDLQRFLNYKALFSRCYLENNELESEEITENEMEILEDLDHDEVFENLKDLLVSLLFFKRKNKKIDTNALETIHSHTEQSKSEEEAVDVLIQENKHLKIINNELKEKVDHLTKTLEGLNFKVSEQEKQLREKEETFLKNRIKTNKPIVTESNDPQPKPKGFNTPHKRISSYSTLNEQTQTIKSVKFDYYIGNQKIKNISTKNFVNLVLSPSKPKVSHTRTASNFIKMIGK